MEHHEIVTLAKTCTLVRIMEGMMNKVTTFVVTLEHEGLALNRSNENVVINLLNSISSIINKLINERDTVDADIDLLYSCIVDFNSINIALSNSELSSDMVKIELEVFYNNFLSTLLE